MNTEISMRLIKTNKLSIPEMMEVLKASGNHWKVAQVVVSILEKYY